MRLQSENDKMYLLKNKGTAKIPDYIQIRDNDFNLLAHIKSEKVESEISLLEYIKEKKSFLEVIAQLEYGKIVKFEI